jgi:hypothetical protein
VRARDEQELGLLRHRPDCSYVPESGGMTTATVVPLPGWDSTEISP